jgi:hypothetical protein
VSYSLFVETCGAHTSLGPVVLVCRAIVHQSVCTCTEEPGVSRGLESQHIGPSGGRALSLAAGINVVAIVLGIIFLSL